MLKENQLSENRLAAMSQLIANLDDGFVNLIACAKDIEAELRTSPRRSAQDMLIELAEVMDLREQGYQSLHTFDSPTS